MLNLAMWTTIKTLYAQGYSKTKIADTVKVSRKTVTRILKKMLAGETVPKRKVVPSILESYKDYIAAKVGQELTAVRIWQDMVKEKQYQGSYATVRKYVGKIKLSKDVYIHQVTLPAEEAQVDFGYAGLIPDEDGKLKKHWVFCYELVHSNKNYHQIVKSQTVKEFIQCHINAFKYMGGVPETIKIDNLKSAILEASFYEPEYQKEYINFADYYGFKPIPCRIATPTDKASIECGVKYVKKNFLKGKTFNNIEDVNGQLRDWTDNVCNKRIHGTTKKVPDDVFEKEEKHLLKHLPEKDYEISEWVKRTVLCNCHISYNNNFYSVPYQYVHREVVLQVTDKLLKVYADNKIVATHTLVSGKGKFQTNLLHYPIYKVIGSTEYQNKYRDKMGEIGEYAAKYFNYLLDRQKNYWFRTVKGIIQLAKEYGREQVDIACGRALHFGAYGYKVIKSICEKGIKDLGQVQGEKEQKPKIGQYQRPLEEYQQLIWKNQLLNN